jgi:hypothetical protein
MRGEKLNNRARGLSKNMFSARAASTAHANVLKKI